MTGGLDPNDPLASVEKALSALPDDPTKVTADEYSAVWRLYWSLADQAAALAAEFDAMQAKAQADCDAAHAKAETTAQRHDRVIEAIDVLTPALNEVIEAQPEGARIGVTSTTTVRKQGP